DVHACRLLFAGLKPHYPQFTNITVYNPHGERVAGAEAPSETGPVLDRSWFQRAIKTRGFVIGNYQAGAATEKPNLNLALPIHGDSGMLRVVLSSGLDLDWLQEVASSPRLPEGWELSLMDENGTIMARQPDGDRWAGKDAPGIRQTLLDLHGEGSARAYGADGHERIYYIVQKKFQQEGGGLYICVGVPVSAAYAESRENVVFYLLCFALLVVLAFAVIGFGSLYFIMRNIDNLIGATKELCAGNLKARTGLGYFGGEIGELARAFDILAHSLEVQEAQRRKSRDALRLSEHRFRMIFDSVSESIFLIDPESKAITDANQSACEMSGYEREELIGLKAVILSSGEPPYTEEAAAEHLETVLSAGSIAGEWQVRSRTGELFWVELNLKLASIDGREAILVTSRDISQRRSNEAEMDRLGRRTELIVNAAGEGIIGLDRQGIIVLANPASAEMLGYEIDEMIGRNMHSLVHYAKQNGVDFPFSECPMSITLTEGIPCRIRDEVLWRKDRTCFPVGYSSTPIVENGQITGAVVTFRDVTARKTAEETRLRLEGQLRQAQKMEAIGTLAGGIAHDFNNILTPIIGYCELSLHEIEKNTGLYKKISQVLKSSLRAKDLVSQILAFARKREQESKPVQISLVVSEALGFLRSSLPSTIAIERRIEPDAVASKVLADPTRIHQIMINLCANAAHAMGEKGGVLGVALSCFEVKPHRDKQFSDLDPGMYLKLTISDTGHGIDEDLQSRIFEPYFTTKSPSEGTGLGLAVVYGIVKSLGGAIGVSSKQGEGAEFSILFPIVQQSEKMMLEAALCPSRGSGHILLVDDERAVADLQKEMVEHLGYKATAIYSSLEALKIFRENPDSFDLILTDQTMPHMTGVELAREVLKIRPDLPIILCTGFSEGMDENRTRGEGISALLGKPLLLSEAAAVIREVLARNRQD
ncbi:MAG: PAS domain S-box protein, partial [Syntrophobacteraceae bacterium]